MASRRRYEDLSPAYRRRLARAGITAENYGKISAQAARGHGRTPEHPERARRNPEKYAQYRTTRNTVERQAVARKEQLWGDRVNMRTMRSSFNARRAMRNVLQDPNTGNAVPLAMLRRFLAMDAGEADYLVHHLREFPEWLWLGYR